MNTETLRTWIEENGVESFSRSAGPGGQNVNKLNTKVTLAIRLKDLPGISSAQLQRLQETLVNRINAAGELLVQAQETRSQVRNREIACQRALDLILTALKPRRPRRDTRPTLASKKRRLEGKKSRSSIKKKRKPPASEDF